MTQKELEQKVIDAEGRVAKREAVLKKHNSQLAKMIEKGDDRFDISIKREDIKSATSKLAEAREILKNWQDKLNTRITRDAYLEANTPEILKDFLENWKQHAIGYYREKRIRFIEYRKDLKAKERAARLEALQTLPSLEKYRELYKGRELTDYDLANLWPRRDVDAFLSERGLEYHQIQKKLREAGDQITLKLLEIHNEDEREAWLEKTMEEEKRAKLLDLIGRIMSTVGTITDAAALRDGIGWTIVYRTGRSWNALTIWSDIWNGEWETDDLNEAIGILKADPDAVIVNGYYCGHFGEDMTIDEIAAGIRWHYEGGRNRLADYCEVTQGRDALEEGRKAAEAAGLPFCERLVDGGDDELSPYVYDGSMTLADREKMQQAREAFEKLADALREIAAKLAEALKPVINVVLSALKKLWKVSAKAIGVPPKWLHLAAHAKKARTRKKHRNRIRRYVFEALAAEGGGGP